MGVQFLDPVRRWTGRLRGSDGQIGVLLSGHRDYVGGFWEEIGRLQFDFLVAEGLRPEHVLLDVGCGSLRGGVYFIPYLDRGHYLGIDKERLLIRRGLRTELDAAVRREKDPQFVVSDDFEFERFPVRPDFALAQSLFTHLPAGVITRCLEKLRAFSPGCRLYATFAEVDAPVENRATSHSRHGFRYTAAEMAAFGDATGWAFRSIGQWGHPRGQVMGEYH